MTETNDYQDFLIRKAQLEGAHGFAPTFMPDYLFDFQRHLIDWSVRKGRSAIMADCGMGKTPMQLVWAQNIIEHTNGKVLILAPLAVAGQIIREAEKFGVKATRSFDGKAHDGITVANYDRLHYFDSNDFVACVCDESSILKSFAGARRVEITAFMRKMKYRLLCSATAAPNDYIELGTSSESLGYLGHMDMLNRFFKNQLNNSATGRNRGEVAKWRFKGHAELPFWRWVCGWARAVRKPSDLGYDDGPFVLPALTESQHEVFARANRDGLLFSLPAVGLAEQREERNITIRERCEKVAELVNTGKQALAWCHMNEEGRLLREMIPGAVEVAGADSDEAKEERLLGFANNDFRVLITKPKIGAWGLNFQNCDHMTSYLCSRHYKLADASLRADHNRYGAMIRRCLDGRLDCSQAVSRDEKIWAQIVEQALKRAMTEEAADVQDAGEGEPERKSVPHRKGTRPLPDF